MLSTLFGFFGFTFFVFFYTAYRLRNDNFKTSKDYFLGGKSLSGSIIAGSMLLTNISTEHLIGMNGSAYKNGMIVIAWEVTSAIALVIAAIYLIPRFLRMGLTTIPEFLEQRFNSQIRSIVAFLLMLSFIITLLPIVLYSGAINLESVFDISQNMNISKQTALTYTIIIIGSIGSLYAVIGGLKAVAYSDTLNGIGLLIGGLLIPIIALSSIGDGNPLEGLISVYNYAPEKFNIIGAHDSILPFSTLFTGLMINQIYFWGLNQTIIQRAFGAKNLKEAQKGLIYTGILKIFIPLVIVLPGLIAYYYFKEDYFESPDLIYPLLVKKILPLPLFGLFAAIILGAVLSTFNSVLNSASTIFCHDIYKKLINKNCNDKRLVIIGKNVSIILAILAIGIAPLVAFAPDGLYFLLQELNGIFFIPISSIIIAGIFFKKINTNGAKAGLFFGFIFYILSTFIFNLNIHFVHLWGIEFLLNFIIMFSISHLYPLNQNIIENIVDVGDEWKWIKPIGLVLCSITILIYILLS